MMTAIMSEQTLLLHRWEYDFAQCWYVCIPNRFAVPAKDSCSGCGAIVTDDELVEFFGQQLWEPLTATLNYLTWRKQGELD